MVVGFDNKPGPRALHYREGLGMRWVVRRALDPTRHRRRRRSTNLLEWSLGEVKRRTKVIGRFPGETSCRTLVWAVLDLYISHATNGVRFTQLERQRLRQIRYQGNEQTNSEEVSAA